MARLARGLLGGDPIADDLAQEAWLIADRRGVRDSGFRAGIVRHLALRWRRGEERRRRRELAARPPTTLPRPVEPLERGELAGILATALESLEADQAEAVRLHFLDDLDVRAIAERTGAREDTVRWRIRRGLERLREVLEQRHGGWYRLALGVAAGLALPRAERDGVPLLVAATAGTQVKAMVGIGALALVLVGAVVTVALKDPAPSGSTAVPAAAIPAELPAVEVALGSIGERTDLLEVVPGATAPATQTASAPPRPAPAGALLATLPGVLPPAIAGFVTNDEGPVAEALVVAQISFADGRGGVEWREMASAATSKEGTFNLGRPIGGQVGARLMVAALGHRAKLVPLELELDAAEATPIAVHLERGAVLEGSIYDEQGEPLVGAVVMATAERMEPDELSYSNWLAQYMEETRANLRYGLIPQLGYTDAEGHFEIAGLEERNWFVQPVLPFWRNVDRGPIPAGSRGLVLNFESRGAVMISAPEGEAFQSIVAAFDPITVRDKDGQTLEYRLDDLVGGQDLPGHPEFGSLPVLRGFGSFIDVDLGPGFAQLVIDDEVRDVTAGGEVSIDHGKPRHWRAGRRSVTLAWGTAMIEADWRARSKSSGTSTAVPLEIVDERGKPLPEGVAVLVSSAELGDKKARRVARDPRLDRFPMALAIGMQRLDIRVDGVAKAWPTTSTERWVELVDPDPWPYVVSWPASLTVSAPEGAGDAWWLELSAADDADPASEPIRHEVSARVAEIPFLPHGDWLVRRGSLGGAVQEAVVALAPGASVEVD